MRTGMLAELATGEDLVKVARALRERGYRRLDAFTPYPVHGLEEALGLTRSRLGWLVFPVAIAGAALGYMVQWFCNAYDYPINVGGRPPHSAPAFIPISFESGVLTTGLVGLFIFLLLCHLPELHHPVFDVEGFERASIDRFWVGIDERDPMYNPVEVERVLRDLGALRVERARGRRA